jgi:adenylate cyclase 1
MHVTATQNKVTEKFKRPFKKRHSSVYHQPTNRVNKFLSQAIEARSVDREKSVHVSRFSLSFREREKEQQYREDFDLGFTTAMGCSLLLLILSAGLQVSQLCFHSNVFLSNRISVGFFSLQMSNLSLVIYYVIWKFLMSH